MSFKKAEHLKIDEEKNEIALSLFFYSNSKTRKYREERKLKRQVILFYSQNPPNDTL